MTINRVRAIKMYEAHRHRIFHMALLHVVKLVMGPEEWRRRPQSLDNHNSVLESDEIE